MILNRILKKSCSCTVRTLVDAEPWERFDLRKVDLRY